MFITSASRLVLGITEALLARHGTNYAYCDTDGIGIPPEHVVEVQDYFQSLTPYSFNDQLFKVEKTGTFYGISAKRYVIFEMERNTEDNRIQVAWTRTHYESVHQGRRRWREKPLNKQIWKDILAEQYQLTTGQEILEKYRELHVVSKLAITTPNLMHRFKFMNKGKPYSRTIKPFSFMLAGGAIVTNRKTSASIKPIAPYRRDARLAPHGEFIDYHHGGGFMKGSQYWKSLEDFYCSYKDHPESKFDGDIGLLQRKHLLMRSKVYIGKEQGGLYPLCRGAGYDEVHR